MKQTITFALIAIVMLIAALIAVTLLATAAHAENLPQPAVTITGSFADCERRGNDYIIRWTEPTHQSSGVLLLANSANGNAIVDWDWPERTGIIVSWETDKHQVVIADPDNYFKAHKLHFTVKLW
ncbi:MAG: hypothetical protein WC898_02270 [Candidatus Paceibacterota bacterium]|jgi:hypothetical protein